MLIIEDRGQQSGKHKGKHLQFQNQDTELLQAPLPVGDYILATDEVLEVIKRRKDKLKKMDFMGSFPVSVDTKKDIQELVGNICGKQHARFRDECILAQNAGIKLYILVENEHGVKSIDDLFRWHNPRLDIMVNSGEIIGTYRSGKPKFKKTRKYPSATIGSTLAKVCLTMQKKYGVEFLFCEPKEAGSRVIELLAKK